jgi:hypothetical protein
VVALAIALASCSPAAPAPSTLAPVASTSSRPTAEPLAGWEGGQPGRYHSLRHGAFVPLPDGRAWQIDDHTGDWLVATHPPTTSVLRLRVLREPHGQSKAKCEARARTLDPTLPRVETGRLIVESDDVIPAWDAHLTAFVVPKKQSLDAHLMVFAANLRRCLIVHYATRSSAPDAEAIVGARLADVGDLVRRIVLDDERAGPAPEPRGPLTVANRATRDLRSFSARCPLATAALVRHTPQHGQSESRRPQG